MRVLKKNTPSKLALMEVRPTQGDEKTPPATTLYRTVALPLSSRQATRGCESEDQMTGFLYPQQRSGAPRLARFSRDVGYDGTRRTILSVVIRREAEGSAVPRTFPGNVFRPERSVVERSAVLLNRGLKQSGWCRGYGARNHDPIHTQPFRAGLTFGGRPSGPR